MDEEGVGLGPMKKRNSECSLWALHEDGARQQDEQRREEQS